MLGLEQTASEGMVSAVRDLPGRGKLLQITAAISPGSSGGPVLNSKGEVVGIACFLLAEGQSLNFAIPINQVHRKLTGAEELTPLREPGLADFADWPEALYLRGFLALPQEETAPDAPEKFEAAAALFRSAIEKRKDFRSAYLSLGYCLDRLERYEEAVEAYKQAIRIDPEDTWGYYNVGVAYENLDRHQQAVDAYKQAIRTDPDVAQAHAALGKAYMRQGGQYVFVQPNPDWTKGRPLFEQATECFKEAIRLQPDDVQLHADLGLMYSLLGRPREAVEVLTDAIRLKPDHAYAHFHLGGAYLDLGDRGQALEEYKVLKELDAHLAAELFNMLYP